jgi:CheY-like chemotaxis protein
LSAAADAASGDARLLGLLEVMRAHLRGDVDARVPVTPGESDTIAELCRVFNAVAERAQVLQSEQLPTPRRPVDDAGAETQTQTQPDVDTDVDIPAQSSDSDKPPAVLVVEAGSDTEAETNPVGPMRSAAHTALRGLGGVWNQAEVLTVRSPAEALAATATRRVVSVLVDARGPLGILLAILAALDTTAPGVPLLCFAPDATPDAYDQAGDLVRGRTRAEIVRSPEQAVERLTLHWLTAAPGISDPHPEPTDPGYGQLHFKGEKALVVDDDVRNVFAMVSALELHGLTALTADSGPEAVEILRRTPDISIVLMDLMMPGMDGYTTTARIRAHPEFARLPIIAVTARAAVGDRERSLAAGLDEHVTKPVKVDRLLTLVRQLIGT